MRADPDCPSFSEEIYALVERIPPGRVMTYGQVAWTLGRPRAARQVGYAMARAPAERDLPCHRVVDRLGRMAHPGVFGGEDRQRNMLKAEGVPFLDNGRVDLGRALFNG